MNVVVDTNILLAVALGEPECDSLVRAVVGHELIAPTILPFEVGNALTAMVKKRILEADEISAVWNAVERIPVHLRRIDMKAALSIAVVRGIYAYDAYFLECAARHRAPLLTLDNGMRRVARELSIDLLELSR